MAYNTRYGTHATSPVDSSILLLYYDMYQMYIHDDDSLVPGIFYLLLHRMFYLRLATSNLVPRRMTAAQAGVAKKKRKKQTRSRRPIIVETRSRASEQIELIHSKATTDSTYAATTRGTAQRYRRRTCKHVKFPQKRRTSEQIELAHSKATTDSTYSASTRGTTRRYGQRTVK